jgi:hypothetical protein
MWILLCGNFEHESMLKSIDELDALGTNAPPPASNFKRPFTEMNIPDITRHRSQPLAVRGPSESPNEGLVQIGFLSRPAHVRILNVLSFIYAF